MQKTKTVCVAGSAGLAVLTLAVVVAVNFALLTYFLGEWVAPPWLAWLSGGAIVVLTPLSLYLFYRLFFESCGRRRAQWAGD